MAGSPPVRRPANLGREQFSTAYKQQVFYVWYQKGKCGPDTLVAAIPPSESGYAPARATVQNWINNEFLPQGEALDEQVRQAMEARLLKEKVQMLEEHTTTAQSMQKMALTYLETQKDNLKVPNAVRMLVEGIRIERESRGIPAMLDKMVDRSDEDLLNQLQEIMSKAPPTLEASTDDYDE